MHHKNFIFGNDVNLQRCNEETEFGVIMTTQVELAKHGSITDEMRAIAELEDISVEKIRDRLVDGRIIIICGMPSLLIL